MNADDKRKIMHTLLQLLQKNILTRKNGILRTIQVKIFHSYEITVRNLLSRIQLTGKPVNRNSIFDRLTADFSFSFNISDYYLQLFQFNVRNVC